jgi:hypothetical protein
MLSARDVLKSMMSATTMISKAPLSHAPEQQKSDVAARPSRSQIPVAIHACAAPGHGEVPSGSSASFDFSRVPIGPLDDAGEREADRKADQVLRADGELPGAALITPHASRSVQPPIKEPGQRLDEDARASMEPRFGFDFSRVRVHAGTGAVASARAVGARAYAVGDHLVFGQGEYAPSTAEGRRLLAHELAHVVADGSGDVIRRQPVKTRTWAQIWPEFDAARNTDAGRATTLANELASTTAAGDDLLDHGMEVVDWLHTHGSVSAALQLLAEVRKRFKAGPKASGKALNLWDVSSGSFAALSASLDPEILINRGKEAARAGHHDQALQFFGVANEILWMYVQQVSQSPAFGHPGLFTYPELNTLYGRLREIYEFYPRLEEQARASGDRRLALDANRHGAALRAALGKEFTPVGEAELAEFEAVKTSRGDALRLEGANMESEDLTELPGLASPKEVASKTLGGGTQVEEIATLQGALMSQVDLQTDLGRQPEIRKAFPSGPIDLNDTATRQSVWGIMYGVYKREGANPLESVMTLIGRYLKAFTHHTTYNIRDFGPNYLDSAFPVDVAGQAERDCGVYALTVAWDVFQTVKQDPDLDVAFSLDVMLDHIVLVIDDKTTAQTYVVSNDRITRIDPITLAHPRESQAGTYDESDTDVRKRSYIKPDSEETVAREYASVRDLPFIVSPVIPVDLGSTRTKERVFHDQIWSRYLKATAHASGVTAGVNARLAKINAPLPGGRGAITSVFEAQEGLSNALRDFDASMDAMEKLPLDTLTDPVDKKLVEASALMTLFEMIARSDKGPDPKHPVQVGSGRGVHPLVRFASLILRVQAAGGTLSTTIKGTTKDGKPTVLHATDFVQHVRGFFGAP